MSTITINYKGLISTMCEAVNDKDRKQLKRSDFYDPIDFVAYKNDVLKMHQHISRMEDYSLKGMQDEADKEQRAFYDRYKDVLATYFSGDGVVYVPGRNDHLNFKSQGFKFVKGVRDYRSMSEVTFRRIFENIMVSKFEGCNMHTIDDLIREREERKAAKKAAAKAAKEAAKQEKPDGRPEEIDVHKDKKEQQKKKEGAAA